MLTRAADVMVNSDTKPLGQGLPDMHNNTSLRYPHMRIIDLQTAGNMWEVQKGHITWQ
jgi:hypothetical protein